MVGIKNNRRVQYTQAQLKQALLQLLATQKLSNITVTAICQVADVNRGTFYAHYDNPAALFAAIEQDLVAQVIPLIKSRNTLLTWLPQVLAVIRDGDTAATIILQNLEDSPVLRAVLAPMKAATITEAQRRFGDAHADYYFDFLLSGSIHVITRWLAGGCQESPDAIAQIIANATQLSCA